MGWKTVMKQQKLVEKMTIEEKAAILSGKTVWQTREIDRLSIPSIFLSDGPHGIRKQAGAGDHLGLNASLNATCFPTAATIANSWNQDLGEEIGQALGEEAASMDVNILLGPGLNIKRSPLCGRNFEYFSEDPYLTGTCAAAAVRGIGKTGAAATIKHFACNNQEKGRTTADSVVSQRALREIYLKGFEMAVKEGKARSLMTSYNPLNGHWTASNYDLCTTVLRGEWGYEGIVMTDWWAKMNDPVEGGKGDMKNTAAMVRAQNDLYMVVGNGGSEENIYEDNTLEALESGNLSVGELQRCAMNICRFILESPVAKRPLKTPEELEKEAGSFAFVPVKLIPEKEETMRLSIEHTGRYKFFVKLRSGLSQQAQSSCNLLLNGKPVATVQTNGTGNEWNLIKLENIYLEPGDYQAALQDVKAGMEIAWVEVCR